MSAQGTVVALYLAPAGEAPMKSVKEARAVSGKGLEGDRYFNRTGTFSNQPGTGRDVTLIELEALEALQRDYAIELNPGQPRRNIVTRGMPLNHLVGIEFAVGGVTLRGTRLCEPCSHLEKLTRKGTMRGLIHRGGLRADIVADGVIRVGDMIHFRG
ncbi:MAG TPA: MOSC domain-containing protein [Candidatus Udaeobacter sp.]|nr:MOSC domain-containing protein [Candidatus Udaeobacter sp.]